MWQADHTPLDVWLLDEAGKPAKPYLTAIEDDYSRMIVGYRLSFQVATALTTALTLRQPSGAKMTPAGLPVAFPASSTPIMVLTSPVSIWSKWQQILAWS